MMFSFNDIDLDIMEDNYPTLEEMESHNRTILRNVKIDITLGNLVLSPNKNRISLESWNKCKLLTDKGFAIGGSVCLKLYGLMDRGTDDFDIFKEDFEFNENMKVMQDNGYDDDEVETNTKRTKLHTRMGTMDIFNKKVSSIMYDGVRLADPMAAYEAKLRYNRLKDYEDFIVLEKKYRKMLNKENYLFI